VDPRLEAMLIEGLTVGHDFLLSADFWRELRKEAAESH
jgi:hypothetical protein